MIRLTHIKLLTVQNQEVVCNYGLKWEWTTQLSIYDPRKKNWLKFSITFCLASIQYVIVIQPIKRYQISK